MAAGGDLVETVERLARAGTDLSVTANLSASVDGVDLAISSEGDRIRVQVPSLRAGLRLARSQGERLGDLSGVLSEAGLTAEVRIGDAVVAVVGSGAVPGTLSTLLSLGPVEVRPRGAAAAALRLR